MVEIYVFLQIMIIFALKLSAMNDSLQTVDVARLQSLASIADEYTLGRLAIIGEITGTMAGQSRALLDVLKYPFRFDGYMLFFLRRGRLQIDFNLSSYTVDERSMLVVIPGNIVKLTSAPDASLSGTDIYFALVSNEFMSTIRFDFQKVFQDSLRVMDNPCHTLDDEQLSMAEGYFHLAREAMQSNQPNRGEMLGALLTSFIYMALGVWSTRQPQPLASNSSARVQQLTERFLALVTQYHNQEHGVAFYANKLCLTPKYLSKLIKEATGRSAPDWIDSYIILEAKNLLKYSDKSIKEIVSVLNFPSQSVFYKFFKAHTGLTPSEYRKG